MFEVAPINLQDMIKNETMYYNVKDGQKEVIRQIKEFCESYYDILKSETGGFSAPYSLTKELFVARIMANVTSS